MSRLLRALLILAACFGMARQSFAASKPKPDLLILVSIDGFRSDYLTHGKTPVLQALADQGAEGPMHPSFPSETFPNHYTLVTGLRPEHHGIVDNTMDDPKLGHFTQSKSEDTRWWSGAEPLWVTADRQGLKTATMFWPGSDRVIRSYRPDYWMAYDKAFLADQRVDQVLKWLDLPEDQRPDFVTLYFDLVDTVGHHDGPYSKALDDALASTDASLGRLVDGLKARGLFDRTNLIVVADHGMAADSKDHVVFLDDLASGQAMHIVTVGAEAGLELTADAPKGTESRLLALRDHCRCWKKADMPRRWHFSQGARIPPITCVAETGWIVTTHARFDKLTYFNLGTHGYDPYAPEMAALFIGEGPGFRRGAHVAPFDNVDVQPLMARLLHLEAPKADGSAKVFQGVFSAH